MTEIEKWLSEGAGVQEGLRLLSIYKPNPYLQKMVERQPDRYGPLLRKALADVPHKAVAETASRSRSFREDWPFLSDPGCPQELKILAADKITAWSEFCRSQEKLFECTDGEQCLETAKKCVISYCQNRKIFSEFAYYKEHGQILGKHPIFQGEHRRKELLSLGPVELTRKRESLRSSVWRLERLLQKADRPDLEGDRRDLLEVRRRELQDVEKLIQDYNDIYLHRQQ